MFADTSRSAPKFQVYIPHTDRVLPGFAMKVSDDGKVKEIIQKHSGQTMLVHQHRLACGRLTMSKDRGSENSA